MPLSRNSLTFPPQAAFWLFPSDIGHWRHRPGPVSYTHLTDAGREGELIFRYIYSYLECRTPFVRLWISSLTDRAIREGLQHLRPGNEYDNLYLSAKARSEADWIVGINASQAPVSYTHLDVYKRQIYFSKSASESN